MKAGPVAFPSASARPIPPVTVATSLDTFWKGVTAKVSATLVSCAATGGRAGAGEGAGRGAVGTISPF